jgi:hypothetical protein
MGEHRKEVPGYTLVQLAEHIEELDYAAQAEFFELLARRYGQRSVENEELRRTRLATKNYHLQTTAFTMHGALKAMARLRYAPPRRKMRVTA